MEDKTRQEVKSFLSYLHFVVLRVLRENERKLSLVVPMQREGVNLVITVQTVPHNTVPSDFYFKMEEPVLVNGVTHVLFNPSEEQLDMIINEQ